MTEIRSILLHLDATRGGAARLAVAQALADRHGAELTVLFGVRPDMTQVASSYSAGAALHAMETGDGSVDVRRERLRLLSCERNPERIWCDVVGESLVHGVVAEAAYADMLVLGQPADFDDGGAPAPGFAEAVILQSGTPALVVPQAHRKETIGDCVLVAWNGSPQAARALKAALPMLDRASQVHVATWARQPSAAPFSGLGVHAFLNRHGIASRVHRRTPAPHIAAELRSLAVELDADLIVMGCYGSSRLRERVFGGVTREVLAGLPAPVLMAH